jgi:hypothetical protein
MAAATVPAYTMSRSNEWLTPQHVLDALGSFDLDPCAHPEFRNRCAANGYCLPEENGLLLPWDGRVFVNPPYGGQIHKWVDRALLHGDAVMLMYARTETAWFQRLWRDADLMLFLYDRLYFVRPSGEMGRAPLASTLFAIGKENAQILTAAKKKLDGALVWGVNA